MCTVPECLCVRYHNISNPMDFSGIWQKLLPRAMKEQFKCGTKSTTKWPFILYLTYWLITKTMKGLQTSMSSGNSFTTIAKQIFSLSVKVLSHPGHLLSRRLNLGQLALVMNYGSFLGSVKAKRLHSSITKFSSPRFNLNP